MLGKFIAIEGGDGAGKTSVVKGLQERYSLVCSREPGGTSFGEEIRNILLFSPCGVYEEMCLFFAARHKHLEEVVFPNLLNGKTVVLDRYAASTYAYQISGRDRPELEPLMKTLLEHCEMPSDARMGEGLRVNYIWLDVDLSKGRKRIEERRGTNDHFDSETLEFHNRVHQGFKDFFQSGLCMDFHSIRPEVFTVDANRELEDVLKEVCSILERIIIAK